MYENGLNCLSCPFIAHLNVQKFSAEFAVDRLRLDYAKSTFHAIK